MTKRKSLLEKIIYLGYIVLTTGVTILVLLLFLIQPKGVWELFTSTHAVGLFGFAAGAILACIITAAVLYTRFSKKIESKNKYIRKLLDDKKLLKAQIRNMAPVEEKGSEPDTPVTKEKNILSEIEKAFPEIDQKEDDKLEEDPNTQDETSADES